MESLRKYLGWAVFCVLGLAGLFGVIALLAGSGTLSISDAFKHGFDNADAALMIGLPYLSRLIIWIVLVVFAVLGILKLVKGEEVEGKVSLLVFLAALAEFLVALFTFILLAKHDAIDAAEGKFWALLIVSLLVVVALILRKFVFKDEKIGAIILAVCALAMAIVYIVYLTDEPKKLMLVSYIIFMLGALVACALPCIKLLKK